MGSSKAAAEKPQSAAKKRREAVVAAAVSLFSTKPYDSIHVGEIADAAGVAHGLPFYYFKDKRGLYLEALRKVADEIEHLHEFHPGEEDARTRLRGLIRRHLEYRRDHPHSLLAMIRPVGHDQDVADIYERARRGGAKDLLRLLRAPEHPRPGLRMAVRGCFGVVDEMTIDWITHDLDMSIDAVEDLVFNAILAILQSVPASDIDEATAAMLRQLCSEEQ